MFITNAQSSLNYLINFNSESPASADSKLGLDNNTDSNVEYLMKIKLKAHFRNINTNLKKRSTNIKKTGHIERSHKQNHNVFKTFLELKMVSWVVDMELHSK